jgi:hypothetical protein
MKNPKQPGLILTVFTLRRIIINISEYSDVFNNVLFVSAGYLVMPKPREF